MSALPEDVRELLAAVHDAINIPMAHWDDKNEQARAGLLDRRASDARIILASVLRGDQIPACTDQLLGWTANRPVTYTVYVPEQVEDGGAVSNGSPGDDMPRADERVSYKLGRITVNATTTRRVDSQGRIGLVADGDQSGQVRYVHSRHLTRLAPDLDKLHAEAIELDRLRAFIAGQDGGQR